MRESHDFTENIILVFLDPLSRKKVLDQGPGHDDPGPDPNRRPQVSSENAFSCVVEAMCIGRAGFDHRVYARDDYTRYSGRFIQLRTYLDLNCGM